MSILTEVRDYLKQRHRASLDDLCNHFDSSPDAMRGMLDQWITRGKVKHCLPTACAQCSLSCASAPGDSYEWAD